MRGRITARVHGYGVVCHGETLSSRLREDILSLLEAQQAGAVVTSRGLTLHFYGEHIGTAAIMYRSRVNGALKTLRRAGLLDWWTSKEPPREYLYRLPNVEEA